MTRLLAVEFEDLLWVRGLAREAQGNLSGALTDMNRVSELLPLAQFEADRARILAALERHNEAVVAQQRAVSLDPGDAGLHVNLGRYAYLASDLDASLKPGSTGGLLKLTP